MYIVLRKKRENVNTMATTEKKLLFIFDFDYTIVNKNTDGEIIELNKQIEDSSNDSFELAESPLPQDAGWSEEMTATLQQLHKKGATKKQIDEVILNIPLTDGFTCVFDMLRKHAGRYNCVMLSHSNCYFIDLLIDKYNLSDVFNSIYTYDCEWVDNNTRLFVKRYDETSFACEICPSDFCKGEFVKRHLAAEKTRMDGVPYDSVVYIGDGSADYCAALQLEKEDHVLVREGFSLHKYIEKSVHIEEQGVLKACYNLWRSGIEVADFLNSLIESS